MKPKEYIAKYHIDETTFIDRAAFIEDLLDDLKKFLSAYKNINVTVFENAINAIRVKWNNIFNESKTDQAHADKFWNYFFATTVVPLRNMYFPNWKDEKFKHRLATDADFRRRYNCWKMHKEIEDFESEIFEEAFAFSWERARANFKAYLDSLRVQGRVDAVKEACTYMGLSFDELKKEDVDKKYRMLAKMTHPDITGTSGAEGGDEFITLKNSRDLIIAYLERNGSQATKEPIVTQV